MPHSYTPRILYRCVTSLVVAVALLILSFAPFVPRAVASETTQSTSTGSYGSRFTDLKNDPWRFINLADSSRYFDLLSAGSKENLKILKSIADQSLTYGFDSDGVSFARKADGSKARYLALLPDHVKLEISKGTHLGTVEIRRYQSNRMLLRYQTARGQSLFVRTSPEENTQNPKKLRIEFQFGKYNAALKMDEDSSTEMTSDNASKLQSIVTGLRGDRSFTRLIETSNIFCETSVATRILLMRGVKLETLTFGCAQDILECYLAILAYVGSISSLILLCPETIGLSCFLAILAHPALGPLAVLKCNNAIQSCGTTPPAPPTTPRYQEICSEIAGNWSEYYGDCVSTIPTSQGECEGGNWWWNPFADLCQLDPPPSCELVPYACDNGGAWSFEWCGCVPYTSPILLDLAGNGFDLTKPTDGVSFNLNNVGGSEKIAWTRANSDDAWLVLDRNHNGTIDNGLELFGDVTLQPETGAGEKKNGFRALAVYDQIAQGGNGDGMIDSRDPVFSSLRLWQDRNHNGISEAVELYTLPSRNVASIELECKLSKKTDEFGNEFRYRAKVNDSKNSQLGRWAWDVFLTRASAKSRN